MAYPYTLPKLPYTTCALEPNLNRATIMQHHNRLFAGHVSALNQALQPYPALHSRPLTQLLLHPDRLPCVAKAAIMEHGGAVYNHTHYFAGLAPARSTHPDRHFLSALERSFGSVEDFLQALQKTALASDREGFCQLVADRKGRLRIHFTEGHTAALPLRAILSLDLYRHAYDLTYGADRAAYVGAVLPLIDWAVLSKRYQAVFAGQPPFPNP